jgi:hypothetical protein
MYASAASIVAWAAITAPRQAFACSACEASPASVKRHHIVARMFRTSCKWRAVLSAVAR